MTMQEPERASWSALHEQLAQLRADMLSAERRASSLLDVVHPEQRDSACNLLHYMALRQRDHTQLQRQLAARGLSSLGRSESHVLSTLEAVRDVVASFVRAERPPASDRAPALSHERGRTLLHEHAMRLLGTPGAERRTRIMVTLPSEAASDRELVRGLLEAGMDCARINAAHDDVTAWRAMARHVREAADALGKRCSIAVDLPGPKCRTGALARGPEVIKLRPRRGLTGEVLEPARAWLTAGESTLTPALPVPADFLHTLLPDAPVTLRDARGRLRRWHVASVREGAVEIVSDRTSYVQRGTVLRGVEREVAVGPLPPRELPLLLHVGDTLVITREATPGEPARRAQDGTLLAPAHIACEPPELVDMVRPGESVWLDDGKIGCVVEAVDGEAMHLRITTARASGEKLRAGKGINLPDTRTSFAAFTQADLDALGFAAEAADMVSMSFVRSPDDVRALHEHLAKLGRKELGVVLKIETRDGFDRLPELLLAAMRGPSLGVMIARGDLAVECGFERLAEVQEEILWLCEAAHAPVIWATQVLESVARTGRPTRAEVTDAAMAERAECVMLNKGPYIREAVALLTDILRRMASHQDKKSAMFRELRVASRFRRQLEQLAGDEPRA
jgi:pyruvate kinase